MTTNAFIYTFTGLVVGLTMVLAWWLQRYYGNRFDREGEATEEEMLAELENEYVVRKTLEIRTQTEYLPCLLETVLQAVDGGFGDRQIELLMMRMSPRSDARLRSALFSIEVGGAMSEIHFEWVCDREERICMRVQAVPAVISALRKEARRIPRSAMAI